MIRGGFTLIELLVTVAIIALLIGILLPSLAGARANAQRLVCASNIRQLAVANTIYASDHADRLAPGAPDFLANLTRWHGSRDSSAEAFRPQGGSLTGYLDSDAASRAVRACPTFLPTTRALEDTTPQSSGSFESSAGGFGYNNAYLGQTRTRSGGLRSDRAGVPIHRAANPSRTIAFADAAFVSDRAPTPTIEYSFVEPRFIVGSARGVRFEPSTHFRHSGGASRNASVAWLDTHVSAETQTFTHTNGLYRTDPADHHLGWTGDEDSNELFDLE